MPKVSVNILTKNRAELLPKAVESVLKQSFQDFEIIMVNDGSTDNTQDVIESFSHSIIKSINHPNSIGITLSREEALQQSRGEYVAVLDDDDEWADRDKLKKQAEFLDQHPEVVLVGGGIEVRGEGQGAKRKFRPSPDQQIRNFMLLRNNFFPSTVMFRREAAVAAGGFITAAIDLAEDYDLWLRLGRIGKMYNFPEVFTAYCVPSYNKERSRQFFHKQLKLIGQHKHNYRYYWIAKIILLLRLWL